MPPAGEAPALRRPSYPAACFVVSLRCCCASPLRPAARRHHRPKGGTPTIPAPSSTPSRAPPEVAIGPLCPIWWTPFAPTTQPCDSWLNRRSWRSRALKSAIVTSIRLPSGLRPSVGGSNSCGARAGCLRRQSTPPRPLLASMPLPRVGARPRRVGLASDQPQDGTWPERTDPRASHPSP